MHKHKKSRAVKSVKKSLFQSQHFTIKISLQSVFTTYVKEEVENDSIGDLISMMKLEEGDILRIISGIRDKAIEIDINDDISL